MLKILNESKNDSLKSVCKIPPVPFEGRWKVLMEIDGNDPLNCGHIDLDTSNAPSVTYMYPGRVLNISYFNV